MHLHWTSLTTAGMLMAYQAINNSADDAASSRASTMHPVMRGQAKYLEGHTECPLPASPGFPTEGGFISPHFGQTLKLDEPFDIFYCSGRYHVESTLEVEYLLLPTDASTAYSLGAPRRRESRSRFRATLPVINNVEADKGYRKDVQYYLVIQEKHTVYAGADGQTATLIPIDVAL